MTRRREDRRFITGAGQFIADLHEDDLLHAYFLRSVVARGRIEAIDASEARALPGVAAVFLAADLEADGIAALAQDVQPPRDDGGKPAGTTRPFLARDEVRHLGEPIALIVAESLTVAEDAAELIDISYDELPCVTSQEQALQDGAPKVWDGSVDNIAFVRCLGDADSVDKIIAGAAHVARVDLNVTRVMAAPLETRAALGRCDADGGLTLYSSSQAPHVLRDRLAKDVFRTDHSRIRVIAPDVGGSFGMKAGVYNEDVLVLWAARRLGRPVRWISTRSEGFLSDEHGRDARMQAELALTEDGEFTALKVRCLINVGAYFSRRSMVTVGNIGGVAGVYRTPKISAEVLGVFTNTSQTAPYRGAGRPEATYIIERLIDIAAREIGIDPFELRRRNLIAKDMMPFQTGLTFRYDSGDFAATMERAAQLSRLDEFEARREDAARRGCLRGIGIANPIEVAGGPLAALRKDYAWLHVKSDGSAELRTGVMSVGQSHETVFSTFVADRLGISVDAIQYVQGDTGRVPEGRGSGGSSALCIGGAALHASIEAVVKKGKELAADHLEAASHDIVFEAGRFSVAGTDLSLSLGEVATLAEARSPEGLAAEAEFLPSTVTYPNGCHICEVEIDPETGSLDVVRYVAVEDVGRVMNRVFVEGQIQGGIAQGVGQAIGELILYDPASGQLMTGTFTDYQMPRATDMPQMVLETIEVPTEVNPLGVKGVGEAGTVGSLAATMNAICDALAPLGIRHVDMPATPARVWKAIDDART